MDSNYPFNIVDQNRFKVDPAILEQIRKEKRHWDRPPVNKPLENFKDIHAGKDGVIFNPGPSLKYFQFEDFKKISDEFVAYGHKGVSHSDAVMAELTYYQFGDGHVERPDRFFEIRARYPEMQTFASAYGCGEYKNRFSAETVEAIKKMNVIPIDTGNLYSFEKNIARYPMVNHFSGLGAGQFLLYTGVKKIYLVGTDATVALDNEERSPYGGHSSAFAAEHSQFTEPVAGYFFSNECSSSPDPHFLQWWIDFKEHAEDEYPDVEIISINPVGLKGVFEDVYLCDPALLL